MRVCIVAEGCYPFVVGGVSSWVHSLIQLFPETEFVILAIAANRSQRGKYAYELPKNVSAVYELYLDDVDWSGSKKLHRKRLKKEQYQALRSLILDQDIEWDVLFDLFQKENVSLNALLMGEDFLNAVRDCYNLKYSQIVFSDFLWTMRSIYLPLFLTMQTEIPRADLYHCVATGYAGVLGAMAKHFYGSRLLISEHGIYTREREEELIKAKWVEGIYKNIWIDQFRKMSKLAYNEGTLITSLFEHARELQIELGCPIEKTMVTPNGIRVENLQNIPGKTEEDEGKINIGAVLRVTPIKDVKTMIQAFGFAKEKDDRLKLWIMGPWEEDREYAEALRYLYTSIGYDCHCVSAITGEGFDFIDSFIANKITLLSGHSGVGKSTIIDRILPNAHVKIGAVSTSHHKGMHTTTFSEMYPLPQGGYIIDTPGIKGFGTIDFNPNEVAHFFPEIFEISQNCRFNNCTHRHEPGCAVLKALENHQISESRYTSYLSIIEDSSEGKYREAF